MSTLKMLREVKRRLELEGIKVLRREDRDGHQHLIVQHPDNRRQTLVMGGSPKSEHDQIVYAMQAVRRFARRKAP